MLIAGGGQSPDELISAPSESKMKTSPTYDKALTLDFSTKCDSIVETFHLKSSGEAILESCIWDTRLRAMMSES